MVKEEGDLLPVGQGLKAAGFKLPYRQWPGSVLGKGQVYPGNDKSPGVGIAL
jgi:hypothetical protein